MRLTRPDRRGIQHWIKTIGHARWSLPDDWLESPEGIDPLRSSGFPRRPRIAPGDRLVYYAAGWKRLFAIVEVTGEPYGVEHPRWPWQIAVEPLLVIPILSNAPPVEAAGVAARSLSQQSHVRMTGEQYRRAVEAIGSVAQ